MDIAAYQEQVYPNPPCWQLVADVYTSELELPVDEYREITESVRQLAGALRQQAISEAFRLELHKGKHGFAQVAEPVDFAVVMMGRTGKRGVHHVGIYYQGSVLHALPCGVLYQDLATLQDEYQVMQFWVKQA